MEEKNYHAAKINHLLIGYVIGNCTEKEKLLVGNGYPPARKTSIISIRYRIFIIWGK